MPTKDTRISRPCQHCGKPVLEYPKKIARGLGKYCSKACQTLGAQAREQRICVICGATFTTLASSGQRYCRRRCYWDTKTAPLRPLPDRFWEKVNTTGECWEWTHCTNHGYGTMSINGRTFGAHRVSWELHFGPIPDGLHVLHACDNRLCVRPSHLFLGTNDENIHDMVKKRRHRYGENAPSKIHVNDPEASA